MVEEALRQQGAKPTKETVQGVIDFVREYSEHVPLFLQQTENSAREFGLSSEVRQILHELESYWFEANDVIPDHHGLFGILDDAYASLALLQALSDYCQATFDRPLLQEDLTVANQAIRRFIGEPVVSAIDQRIAFTLGNAMTQRILGQITNSGFTLPPFAPPLSDGRMGQIVDAQLGRLGVVS